MKCWVCVLNHGGGHHQVTLAGLGSEGQGSWGGRAAAGTVKCMELSPEPGALEITLECSQVSFLLGAGIGLLCLEFVCWIQVFIAFGAIPGLQQCVRAPACV